MRRLLVPAVTVAFAAAASAVLPRSHLTPATLLAVALLVGALGASLVLGPRPLLLGVAALCLAAAIAGTATVATVRERDLAVGLMPLVLSAAAASLLRPGRAAVAVVLGGLIAGPLRMLVYDPFLDPSCDGCAPGVMVVRPMPHVAELLHPAGMGVALVAMLWGVRRGPGELLGIVAATTAYTADVARRESLVVGCLLAALALGRETLERHRRRRRLDALALALEAGADVAATEADVADDPVAALAWENRRLTAELAATVAAVTAARESVVRVAATERRILERDLHDAVQQQLLALGLDLRLALTERPRDIGLGKALEQVRACLDDVREITHGVYPPLLATRGLAVAAAHLERKQDSTTALDLPTGRFDPDVERAAFAVVAEALRRGADSVTGCVREGWLSITAAGVSGFEPFVEDLVGALAGRLATDGEQVVAMVPCESP